MIQNKFKSIFLIIAAVFVFSVANPQQIKAGPSFIDVKLGECDTYMNKFWVRWMCVDEYYLHYVKTTITYTDLLGISWKETTITFGNNPLPPYPCKRSIPTSSFDFIANGNLQIKSSVDVLCDVYELESCKQMIKNVAVAGNDSYQILDMQHDNKPYIIQFKVDGQVVHQQSFYFSNKNQIIKGVVNE